MDNDIEFEKQSQKTKVIHSLSKAKKYAALRNCKLNDLVYLDEESGKYYISAVKLNNKNLIAKCCIEADKIDEYPRFLYLQDGKLCYGSDYILNVLSGHRGTFDMNNYQWETTAGFKNFLNTGSWINDINGYNNTDVLVDVNSPIAKDIKNKNPYAYLPAAGELYEAEKYEIDDIFSNLVTSTQADEWMLRYHGRAHQDYSSLTSLVIRRTNNKYIVFFHLDENNIIIK